MKSFGQFGTLPFFKKSQSGKKSPKKGTLHPQEDLSQIWLQNLKRNS
jgi:hypothetical protein